MTPVRLTARQGIKIQWLKFLLTRPSAILIIVDPKVQQRQLDF